MSANQPSIKWTSLASYPRTNYTIIPTGIDRNNYIVIDRTGNTKINGIYKYIIENDTWMIKNLNNIENITTTSAALDVGKQILFTFSNDFVTQIQLNSNRVSIDNHNIEIDELYDTVSIIKNDSLFIIGGSNNNSILKWSSESKTFTKYCDMYNETFLSDFGIV
eukprot:222891_1